MKDQANDLRLLARTTLRRSTPRAALGPKLIVVASAQAGVGATTLANNLACALAQQGRRAVLVEAAPQAPEAAAQQHLIDRLPSLRGSADFVVVDAGSAVSGVARQLWQAADVVLLVTTGELASVTEAYALVKALAAESGLAPIEVVVNMAPNRKAADDVYARLCRVCRRFLGVGLRALHWIPKANGSPRGPGRQEPWVLSAPRSRAARLTAGLARRITKTQLEN